MFKSSVVSFIALAFMTVSAAPTNSIASDIVCSSVKDSISLRRMYRADLTSHFYSTYGPEVARYRASKYVEEAPQGRIYRVQEGGTVPFWRCVSNLGTPQVDYFYTADPGEWRAAVAKGCHAFPEPAAAGISEGIGYIYTAPHCGSVPLYRLYSGSLFDHFYTINPTERQNYIKNGTYVDQGIAGYVLPN